ncbi:hypothetical protein BDQ17DRAFT_1279850 [Cyathus striatus]|nr:hypothetical protein BDQ17DRAFT_1279850 [Cyathus striatus]
MFSDRKSSYKLPPTTIRDKLVSQEARRSKALEEQKRRRAQKIDSSRNLEFFADLTLGPSDEEEDDEAHVGALNVSTAAVAPFVSMLEPAMVPNAITDADVPSREYHAQLPTQKKKKKKKKKRRSNKPSKWGDKCMYAELLEMAPDSSPWSDGIPNDLETGWVAIAPVPVGKRCLAVTHQSSGVAGVVPNTILRSRLLGKALIHRFPSSLPPLTVLDCILDANWRENGILHVLDVIKWKGQDVTDCEASFRFWWRDTRLAELAEGIPPNINFSIRQGNTNEAEAETQQSYHFPYPTRFVPIPYHTDTTLSTLYTQIIPFARTPRPIPVQVPALDPTRRHTIPPSPDTLTTSNGQEEGMEVEGAAVVSANAGPQRQPPSGNFTFRSRALVKIITANAEIQSDGLLLYVAQAGYEPGTSPLSSWIPIISYDESKLEDGTAHITATEGPLDIFQRLVKRRLDASSATTGAQEVLMDMDV